MPVDDTFGLKAVCQLACPSGCKAIPALIEGATTVAPVLLSKIGGSRQITIEGQ
ncbi:MAG: hypothetical protein IPP14_05745 [Planctomycetes bacterium]|nr:hypothetical protein [Planctomycetota bacterium]